MSHKQSHNRSSHWTSTDIDRGCLKKCSQRARTIKPWSQTQPSLWEDFGSGLVSKPCYFSFCLILLKLIIYILLFAWSGLSWFQTVPGHTCYDELGNSLSLLPAKPNTARCYERLNSDANLKNKLQGYLKQCIWIWSNFYWDFNETTGAKGIVERVYSLMGITTHAISNGNQ